MSLELMLRECIDLTQRTIDRMKRENKDSDVSYLLAKRDLLKLIIETWEREQKLQQLLEGDKK